LKSGRSSGIYASEKESSSTKQKPVRTTSTCWSASPPKYSVSEIMGYLKGKSSLIIFERHANLKYRFGSRHFWCRGYFVDTVGKNAKKIEEYIKHQLQEDMVADQISIKEYIDPFTGEPVEKSTRK
jgi:putative transposase